MLLSDPKKYDHQLFDKSVEKYKHRIGGEWKIKYYQRDVSSLTREEVQRCIKDIFYGYHEVKLLDHNYYKKKSIFLLMMIQ